MSETPHELTPEGSPTRPVEKGQHAYLLETGTWMFTPADDVFGTPGDAHFYVGVNGPFSSTALAEEAADRRLARIRPEFFTVQGQMEPYAQGLRGPHAGVVSWKRDVTWHDYTGEFGDKDGWQQIRLVYVDEMPD